ncbi:hypothetical protein FOA52_004756 [Chlamydomonas sp. UWO 241]|nr:hypothetical protein FOA52_004756 [Chlamydomonas sp. UWO 241]
MVFDERSLASAAYSCLLGGAVGDAVGAVLEFYRTEITHADVEAALSMPGGGAHCVGRGQVTDDTELSIALASALVGADPSAGFPSDAVARAYREWAASDPFDIGNTCAAAFMSRGPAEGTGHGAAASMQAAASASSSSSEANGALMRCAPIAVWGCRLPAEGIAEAARTDARLSHPSDVCQDASAAYVVALAHLITHPEDASGALAAATSACARNPCVTRWLCEESAAAWPPLGPGGALHCAGHARWGFVLAFGALRSGASFADALRATLLAGGDTDTNAAIVGAMVGALHGSSSERGVPPDLVGPVLNCDPSARGFKGRPRPACYAPSRLRELTTALLPAQ